MSRKALAAVMAAWLALTVPSAALAQTSPFVDVPQDHWASQAIANLAAAGLVEGYPDGTFGGSRTLTRYEAAMVFSRMLARLESLLHRSVSEEVQGLSDQVAGDVSQRVMARATAEIQQSIAAAREQLARDLERMVAEQVAAQRVVERVVVEKQPQVTERVVVEQPRAVEMTPEVRQAIAEAVAQELPGALAEFRQADEAWRAGIKSDVAATRAELADLQGRLNVVDNELQAATGRLATLESTSGNLADRVTALENGSTENFGQLFRRTEDLEKRVESLGQASATREDVSKLSAEVSAVRRNQTWFLVGLVLAAVAGVLLPSGR